MAKGLMARASTEVNAPPEEVWAALTEPQAIERYMFGTTAVSDWREGSPIVWKGEWQGKPYEDRGVILRFEPFKRLAYSHFSPLSGLTDLPENYHMVTIELSPEGAGTHVALEQDNNDTEEERDHASRNWEMVLAGLKGYLEGQPAS
ncbi:MAG TPA: SRPBCC domain-containing protein [Anaerolineales bacterium]|nr:SRPBCC domain-containing protein [Anaerolineales bacterium]